MKTYIPKQPKLVRERIEVKLDSRIVERLEKYCLYLESDREYVLAQILEIVFRKDKGFTEWIASHQPKASATVGPANTPQSPTSLTAGTLVKKS